MPLRNTAHQLFKKQKGTKKRTSRKSSGPYAILKSHKMNIKFFRLTPFAPHDAPSDTYT